MKRLAYSILGLKDETSSLSVFAVWSKHSSKSKCTDRPCHFTRGRRGLGEEGSCETEPCGPLPWSRVAWLTRTLRAAQKKTEIKKKPTLCTLGRETINNLSFMESILYVEHETSYVACREEECVKCETVWARLVVYSLNDWMDIFMLFITEGPFLSSTHFILPACLDT